MQLTEKNILEKNLELQEEERHEGRAMLLNYLVSHPYPSRTTMFRARLHAFARPVSIACVIVLLFGVGTSYAAEQSLPGDPLYPVKINVNEQVRTQLAVSSEQKAAWNAERVKRRMQEAARLAQAGKLDAKKGAALAVALDVHLNAARKNLEEMHAQGRVQEATDISSSLESSVSVHEALLEKTTPAISVAPLKVKLSQALTTLASDDERDDAVDTTKNHRQESAVASATHAKAELEDAEKELALHTDTGVETKSEVRRHLDLASEEIRKADTLLNVGDFAKATKLFRSADRSSAKGIAVLDAQEKYHVGVQVRTENRDDEILGISTSSTPLKIHTRIRVRP